MTDRHEPPTPTIAAPQATGLVDPAEPPATAASSGAPLAAPQPALAKPTEPTRPAELTAAVLAEVAAERRRQDSTWGEQNHADGTRLTDVDRVAAESARRACQDAFASGAGTWRLILDEEVREAFAESSPEALRAELVQVAAVAVAWIEAIDRRSVTTPKRNGG